jgi:L-amino acid N-acyltransferase YncA
VVRVREARSDDWPEVWAFLHDIVLAGETYAYDPAMSETEARLMWFLAPPARTVVAVSDDDAVIGSANMYANRGGGGSHVASASFMVDPRCWGQGAGRALGHDAIDWARREGFRAMQFNAVVESNTRAVELWKSLGFEIVGTVPESFKHPTEGYVGLHVMYRFL